jgi:proteasome-associated ATPase
MNGNSPVALKYPPHQLPVRERKRDMSESERSEAFGTPMSSDDAAELEELRREAAALREQLESAVGAQGGLRSARDVHQLEARIDSLAARNAKLMETLKEARQQLLALREEVDRLGQPPSGYGVLLSVQMTPSTCSPRAARCG